jgi:hypothetical protein
MERQSRSAPGCIGAHAAAMAPRHVSIANALKARFPDELVREIAVFTPYLGPEMGRALALSGNVAGCMAPAILRQRFSKSWSISAAWSRNQPALLCPMVRMRRPSRPSMRRPSSQLSTPWHHPPGPPIPECRRARRPGGAGGAERRRTASPTAPRTPGEAAAERPARAWATPENVIHFRLDD